MRECVKEKLLRLLRGDPYVERLRQLKITDEGKVVRNTPLSTEEVLALGDKELIRYILNVGYNAARDSIADELFKRFGSLSGIFTATLEELTSMGVSERIGFFLSFISALSRVAQLREMDVNVNLSEKEALQFASTLFMNNNVEQDYLLISNRDGTLKYAFKLGEKQYRDVIGLSCRHEADDVIWICNKPRNEHPMPSYTKLYSIELVMLVFRQVGIHLIDYLECGHNNSYSLRRTLSGKNGEKYADYVDSVDIVDKMPDYVYAVYRSELQSYNEKTVKHLYESMRNEHYILRDRWNSGK